MDDDWWLMMCATWLLIGSACRVLVAVFLCAQILSFDIIRSIIIIITIFSVLLSVL